MTKKKAKAQTPKTAKRMPPMQEFFVREYLVDFNATQAAKRAGYSPKTCGTQGERLLRNVEIHAAIEKAKAKLLLDRDKIVLENIEFWKSIRGGDKNHISDRLKASELLGRYASMFVDKHEHKITSEEPIIQIYIPDNGRKADG